MSVKIKETPYFSISPYNSSDENINLQRLNPNDTLGFEYDYLPDINVYSNRFDIPEAYERTIKCRMLYKNI